MKHIGYPNNDKAMYLERVRRHREADELIRREGWTGSRGCAIGCSIHEYNHNKYSALIGVCKPTARLIDWLFENMPDGHLMFPERVLSSIEPGADLSRVYADWQVRLQSRNLARIPGGEEPWKIECRAAFQAVISLFSVEYESTAERAARAAAVWAVERAAAGWESAESAEIRRQADDLIEIIELAGKK